MSGAALLTRLRQAGLTVSRNGDQLIVAPREHLTNEMRDAIRAAKPQLLSALAELSPIQQAARREVPAQLEANPRVERAFVNRFDETGLMILTLAIRGIWTGEPFIPAERLSQGLTNDYAALLECIEGVA